MVLFIFNFSSFNFDLFNIKKIDAQFQQQYPQQQSQQQLQQYQQQQSQMQWQIYKSSNTKMSIQYPTGWKVVENVNGFDVFSPDNSFNVGIGRLYKGSSPIYGHWDFQIQEIGKNRIQSMLQNGFSLTSSQLLGNQDGFILTPFLGNILKNVYSDNIDQGEVVIEFLQLNDIDTLFLYYLEGHPSQIQKYRSIATKILQTIGFDSSWELQKLKERNAANQQRLDTLQPGIDSFKTWSDNLHTDTINKATQCSNKLGYNTQSPIC